MSDPGTPCEIFESLDLAAYIIDPEASEWTDFRAHFPTCDTCSQALESWSNLEWELAEIGVGIGSHPAPADLDRYAGGLQPGESALRPAQRSQIESHLSTCSTCSDEIRALERYAAATPNAAVSSAASPGAPTATSTAPSTAPSTGADGSIWDSVRDFFGGLQVIPVLSVALLALVAGWWFLSGSPFQQSGDAEPRIAKTPEMVPKVPLPRPHDDQGLNQSDPTELAHSDASDLVNQPDAGSDPSTDLDVKPEPQVAAVEPGPVQSNPAPRLDSIPDATLPVDVEPRTPEPETAPYEMLVASLDLDSLLAYRGQAGFPGSGRMDIVGRSASSNAGDAIQVVAPKNHPGVSNVTTPLLLWSLPSSTKPPVEIQIVDEREIDPVLLLKIDGPFQAGLHAFDLAQRGIELEPGITYTWSVAILVDPDRPSRNPRSQALLAIAPDAARPTAEAGAARLATGESLREMLAAGSWHDGLAVLTRARSAHPESEVLAKTLASLLSQESIATADPLPVQIH